MEVLVNPSVLPLCVLVLFDIIYSLDICTAIAALAERAAKVAERQLVRLEAAVAHAGTRFVEGAESILGGERLELVPIVRAAEGRANTGANLRCVGGRRRRSFDWILLQCQGPSLLPYRSQLLLLASVSFRFGTSYPPLCQYC